MSQVTNNDIALDFDSQKKKGKHKKEKRETLIESWGTLQELETKHRTHVEGKKSQYL